MSIYPGIEGTYSPEAWRRAALMTDGRITDDLLRLAEDLVQHEREQQEAAARKEEQK
jgi:hypothetical protein